MICASLALLQIMFAVHRFAQGATALQAVKLKNLKNPRGEAPSTLAPKARPKGRHYPLAFSLKC